MSTPYAARRAGPSGIAGGLAAVLGLVIAGCGGGATLRAPHAVHINGQTTGDYVSEVSASGTTFLLPAADVAQQRSHTFHVVDAANTQPASGTFIGPRAAGSRYATGVAQATAVVARDAAVELVATGTPGLRFLLQWTDTCGENGGSGHLVLRTPAVVNLMLPRSTGIKTCYVAATAEARQLSTLHLGILDH
jgi:hypothetical protein